MKVLFIDSVHPILAKKLSEIGFTCTDATTWDRDAILQNISAYQGVVIRSKFTIDHAFLHAAKSLKFIARSGSGLENIDVIAAKNAQVKVYNSPEGNRNAVAEHALGMLLSLLNNIPQSDSEVRIGVWDREGNRGEELDGKTIGIIGYGNTGQRFARKLRGFDVEVLAYDKYVPSFPDTHARSTSLSEILAQSDVISFHVPQTEETTYMLNKEFIARSAKPFYLINTSRGKVVHTADLVEGLKSGKVLGACLDVMEYETKSFHNFTTSELPQPFQYLQSAKNVVLTPHVAGWTHQSNVLLAQYLFEKIQKDFT